MTTKTPPQMTMGEYESLELPLIWFRDDEESWQQYLDQADPRMRAFCNGEYQEDPTDFLGDPAQLQVLLDLQAPEGVPDGYHTVIHKATIAVRRKNARHVNSLGRSTTRRALVKDGHFVVVPTVMAAFQAFCRSQRISPRRVGHRENFLTYDLTYRGRVITEAVISGFTWLPGRKALEVHIGLSQEPDPPTQTGPAQ